MMWAKSYGKVLVLALLAGMVGYALRSPQPAPVGAQAATMDAFAKVQASKTLRCGYIEWPPYLTRDPNTNALSGFTYDLANKMAENLGWKVDWVMPVLLGQEVEALQSGRIDALCGAQAVINPRQALYIRHSQPYVLIPSYAYVAVNSPLQRLTDLNTPKYVTATMDGDISVDMRKSYLPQTREHALPNTANPQQMSLDVISGKADVAMLDVPSYLNFSKAHPNSLRQLPANRPLANLQGVISVHADSMRLLETINDTLKYMQSVGQMQKIFSDYKLLELGMIPIENNS